MTARALSIQQPWAWAITDLDKRVENRSRPTNYRGELFLHASAQARPLEDLDCCTPAEQQSAFEALAGGRMTRGAIVGVAVLDSCTHPADWLQTFQERWAEGPYCYALDDVRKLPEPVPCRGALGFWSVPAEIERAVRAQLEEIDMPRKKKSETDTPVSAREDLGYAAKGGTNGDDMPPDQRRQLVRLARQINAQTKDVEAKASARGQASQALQAAQKELKKLLAEQNAVVSGTWQAGMFDEDEGGDDE